MIVQHIDFELMADNTQAIKVSELKKLLKVMKVYNEQWLHFNLLDIIIGNNRNIVIKNDYNGANFALNTNDIAFDDKYYIRDYCNKYITTYNFNQTVLFSL